MNIPVGTEVGQGWAYASWNEYLNLLQQPAYQHAKAYYNRGQMLIDMSPVGYAHAEDNYLLAAIILAWEVATGKRLKGLINVTLRREGVQDAQPDLAYYPSDAKLPARSNAPLDLMRYSAPDLVIEVSATTLDDDLNNKRKLYAEIGVREYWVIDVEQVAVQIFDLSSARLTNSQVLPGLNVGLIAEALRVGQNDGDGAANQYILDALRTQNRQ